MHISKWASTLLKTLLLAGFAFATAPAFAADGADNHQLATARVMFGRGLNTAQPGNPVNHAILPNEIKIKAGGVVDFGVAGFHDIIVFKPGVTLDDLVNAGGGVIPSTPPVFVLPPDPTAALPPALASLADKIYYRGLNPAGGPPATPPVANPDNGFNRNEPIAFLEAGTYLVICNVRPHLLDGMWATVKVLK
jgi:plastocyanin